MLLFISPPFGNYINLDNAISIKGSFTLQKRSGLLFQIFKTLRYDFKNKGWVNKIGLRNNGIDYAIEKYYKKKNCIISVAILNKEEIPVLNKKIPEDCDIELNISCPNTEKHLIDKEINIFLNPYRRWCILKLSPVTSTSQIDDYYNAGFRQFHCGNTLPVENGGLSGPVLQKYSPKLVKYISETYPDTEIIGGGGIRSIFDANVYVQSGANHISVSTLCFSPLMFLSFYDKFSKLLFNKI